jgi:hypothetical protein
MSWFTSLVKATESRVPSAHTHLDTSPLKDATGAELPRKPTDKVYSGLKLGRELDTHSPFDNEPLAFYQSHNENIDIDIEIERIYIYIYIACVNGHV